MIQQEQRTTIRRLGTQAAKRKNALWLAAGILGAFLAAETSYRVRELLAAELIFGVGLILLSVLVAIFYLVAVACERGFDRTRRAYTSLWIEHHRIFSSLKMITVSRQPGGRPEPAYRVQIAVAHAADSTARAFTRHQVEALASGLESGRKQPEFDAFLP